MTKSSACICNTKLNNFPEQDLTSLKNNSFICTLWFLPNKTNSSFFYMLHHQYLYLSCFFGPLHIEPEPKLSVENFLIHSLPLSIKVNFLWYQHLVKHERAMYVNNFRNLHLILLHRTGSLSFHLFILECRTFF